MVFLFIRHSFPLSSTPLQKGENSQKRCQSSAMASDCITQKRTAYTHVNILMKHAPIYNRHDVFLRVLYIVSFEIARLHAWTNRFCMFLNQAHAGQRLACNWFLKIAFVRDVCMHVCAHVCVCVSAPARLLITSGVIWCDIELCDWLNKL